MTEKGEGMTRETIEQMCESAIGLNRRWTRKDAERLRDLALRRLEAPAGYVLVPTTISEASADVLGMPVSFYERAVRFGTAGAPYPPVSHSATPPAPDLAEVVAELDALEAKATPGPWKITTHYGTDVLQAMTGQSRIARLYRNAVNPRHDTDSAFIVAYRNAYKVLRAAALKDKS